MTVDLPPSSCWAPIGSGYCCFNWQLCSHCAAKSGRCIQSCQCDGVNCPLFGSFLNQRCRLSACPPVLSVSQGTVTYLSIHGRTLNHVSFISNWTIRFINFQVRDNFGMSLNSNMFGWGCMSHIFSLLDDALTKNGLQYVLTSSHSLWCHQADTCRVFSKALKQGSWFILCWYTCRGCCRVTFRGCQLSLHAWPKMW